MIAPKEGNERPAMWIANRESFEVMQQMQRDEEEGQFIEQGPTPDQGDNIQQMLANDLKMVEDWAAASAKKQGLTTPRGIEADDSKALARRLELSAIAMEKLQMSAKSFGLYGQVITSHSPRQISSQSIRRESHSD